METLFDPKISQDVMVAERRDDDPKGYAPVIVPNDSFDCCRLCDLRAQGGCREAPCLSTLRPDGQTIYYLKGPE